MSPDTLKCANCGAALKVSATASIVICAYCNAQQVNPSVTFPSAQQREEPRYEGITLSRWLNWLSSPDPRQFESAANAIERIGGSACGVVEAMMNVIKHYPDRSVRVMAMFAYLGQLPGLEAAMPHLRVLLGTSAPDVQEAILEAMAYIGDDTDADRVFEFLDSPYLPVRLKAIWLLGVPGPHYHRALPTVRGLLDDPNERVRAEARRALLNLTEGWEDNRPLT